VIKPNSCVIKKIIQKMRTLYSILILLSFLSVQAQKTTITQLEVDKLINPLGLI
jgi:hypothetical protein